MITALLLAVAAAVPPVATVNGVPLSRWEVERELSSRVGASMFHRNLQPARRAALRHEALDSLVMKELKRQWAAANAVRPAPGAAEAAWKAVRERFPDDAAYRQALAQQNLTDTEFRAAFARDAAAEAANLRIESGVAPPTEAEQQGFFAEHRSDYTQPATRRLVHLLVYVAPGSDASVAQRAELEATGIALKARAGGLDLAVEAERRRSQLPPRYQEQVGDLGFLHEGALAPEVEKSLQGARPGDVFGPIRSLLGYSVVKVLDLRPARPMSYPEVRDAVAARMLRERRAAALAAFETSLRATATVTETAWPDAP